MQVWAVAALCRSLSLPSICQFLNAVLLEKQIVRAAGTAPAFPKMCLACRFLPCCNGPGHRCD